MHTLITRHFEKQGSLFCKHLSEYTRALMQCGEANTYGIARQLSKNNNKSFDTNEMKIVRFLQNDKFQIDDKFWRCHINMIFEMLEERKVISKSKKIEIYVDFTTVEDKFLILTGTVLLNNKAITIYFSMRNYPKKKGTMSQIKMEEAFIKGLRHVLSKNYQYIIIADRGFGTKRFANFCTKSGFDYVLRINSNLNIKEGDKKSNLKDRLGDEKFTATVISWKEEKYITIRCKDKKIWYLMSSDKKLDAGEIYEKRFKIEKNYQDCKSNGYDLEGNKIRKYNRFKRLVYLVSIAHGLTCFIGDMIESTKNNLKKNSTTPKSQNLSLILAFSELDMKLSDPFLKNPLCCYDEYSYHD